MLYSTSKAVYLLWGKIDTHLKSNCFPLKWVIVCLPLPGYWRSLQLVHKRIIFRAVSLVSKSECCKACLIVTEKTFFSCYFAQRVCVLCLHFGNKHILVFRMGEIGTFALCMLPTFWRRNFMKIKVVYLKCFKVLTELCQYIFMIDRWTIFGESV